MAGTGPSGSPNARRRNARSANRVLPAGGRGSDPPAWPLVGRPKKAELDLWVQLWATPQAVAWDELGFGTRIVARYARIAVMAESPTSKVGDTLIGKLLTESRMLEEALGLSPKGMRSLGWEIGAATPQEATDDADVVDLAAFRDRVTVTG